MCEVCRGIPERQQIQAASVKMVCRRSGTVRVQAQSRLQAQAGLASKHALVTRSGSVLDSSGRHVTTLPERTETRFGQGFSAAA